MKIKILYNLKWFVYVYKINIVSEIYVIQLLAH